MADASIMRVQLFRGGFSPIPVHGKVPALQAWQKHHSTNDEEIALWRKLFPDAINTGILTRLNPVIDADLMVEEAAEAVEGMARDRFEERGFFLVRIGKAPKRAIVLRTDVPFPKITLNLIAPSGKPEKIEVLCDGQQVVVDGVHPETHHAYLWHGGDLGTIKHDDLPYVRRDELVQLLDDAGAMLVRDFGYRVSTSERSRSPAGNGATPHHPPDDWGVLVGKLLGGHDMHDSIRDLAAKYIKAGMSGGATVNALRGMFEHSVRSGDIERFADIPRAVSSAQLKYGREKTPPEQPAEQPAAELPEIIYDGNLNVAEQRNWLVRRLFVLQGTTILAGPPGGGKTTLIVDLAACLTTGMDYAGLEVMTTGAVLVFLGEGHEDFRRAWATVKRKKIQPWLGQQGRPMPERLPFGVIDDPPKLTDPDATEKIVAVVRQAEAELGVKVVMCMFDNFTDLTVLDPHGNLTFETANAMKPLRSVEQQCACACLMIDHTGKDIERGVRDSSVKTGKSDLILIADAKMGEKKGTLKVTKSRSGVGKSEFEYEIEVHKAVAADGLDDTEVSIKWHVDELPAAVRKKIDEKAVMPKARNSVGVRRLLECIDEVMATEGKAVELPLGATDVYTLAGRHSGTPTTVRAVDQDDVWREFLARQEHKPEVPENQKRGTATAVTQGVEDSKKYGEQQRRNTARKLWGRARDFCVVNHLIGSFTRENNTFIWRTPKDSRGTAGGQRLAVPGGQDSGDSQSGA